ncbi:rRNA (cytosine-C(5))-methyltransferase NOP2C-like isoform X7 [Panicum virgatum]|uniref:rRNA (cytosine-C(5))-methyltransferase NOP2C-like isoform X7 n=1 Tax=Panicum virgatum TaxID=38727 RepID=UPI0019D52AD3|nr:rRNA (cytosine-C(5))-methyltransferase NOP2C-like isoform X7 [Panicum virgatum]
MDSSSSSSSPSPSAVAARAADAGRYTFSPKLRWQPEVEEYFAAAYGRDRFARISEALAHPSRYSCIRVNTLKSSTDAVMHKLMDLGSGPHVLNYNSQPDQSVKEVIVSRKCAESVLRGAQVFVPGVLACSSHVEKGDKVAVSVAIEQPVKDGGWAVGITRGTVLQGLQSDVHYEERKGLYIGKGTAAMSRSGIFRVPHGIAVEMTERVYKLPSFNDVLEGEIFLQNLPSVVAAHVLDPQPGERILDMCAAPGGKTTAISILMRDKGEVVALDRSHNKVMDILKLASEMDLSCIKAYKLDALKSVRKTDEATNVGMGDSHCEAIKTLAEDSGPCHVTVDVRATNVNEESSTTVVQSEQLFSVDDKNPESRRYVSKAELRKNLRRMKNGPGRNNCSGGRVEKSKGFFPNSFDRVLLDAPCSALGLRPRLFAGEETLESLKTHAKYQRRMFDQAVKLVRPGGVIVYSTCTINPGENEALVRYALDTYKFLSLVSQLPKVGGPGIVGSCELFNKTYTEEWLTEHEAELVQRCLTTANSWQGCQLSASCQVDDVCQVPSPKIILLDKSHGGEGTAALTP